MRIAIIEDDSFLLENLRLLLNGEEDITVVGGFESAEEAMPEIAKLTPEVLLVDLGLPGMPGEKFIRKVKGEHPEIEIMVYTIYADRESVFAAMKAGASGYILKVSTPRELIESLRDLHSGGSPMSPQIARKVIMELWDHAGDEQYVLSEREKEILRGRESGLGYKQIAEKLNISRHTVHNHIRKIYDKLHAINRQEAVIKARKKGII